jgi:signal transduction histidine kinase
MRRRNLQPGTQEHADAEVISGEIDRLERIVKDFLLFARPADPELKTIPAEQALREVRDLLAPQMEKANIQFTLELSQQSGPALINVDPQQIKQVLINLVQNAADAIGQNGAVTLRVRLHRKRLAERETDVVVLEVADTGNGIPPEVEKRLFDPFFTTKESGTGLGLSIAARIIEKHGGALQYQTRVNHGTTFGIVLRRVENHEVPSSAH